jgi:hypothetical protein
MILLFVAGAIVGAAGLLALGFGIPIKDTTFGNAMLLSSMMLLCSSLILIGLGLVVRELKAVVRALAQGGARVAPRAQSGRPAVPSRLQQPGLAPPVDAGAPPLAAEPWLAEPQIAASGGPPPWAAEAAARDRARNVAAASQQAAAPPPVESSAPPAPHPAPERPARRNLLFATRKRDRAEAAGGAYEDQPVSPELPKMAPPVLPPMPALEAEPRASFDSAWPASSRGIDPFGRRSRRAEAAAPPALAAETPAVDPAPELTPPPLPTAEAAPAVTVIKSGVVDGMAYSLYSDGSIEAQMPEGMLRFASLDALRAHLEQRP